MVLRARGHEAPVRVDAALDGPAAGPRLQVSGTTRLDLRAVGITVPGFLVRRFVNVSLSAELTQGHYGSRPARASTPPRHVARPAAGPSRKLTIAASNCGAATAVP